MCSQPLQLTHLPCSTQDSIPLINYRETILSWSIEFCNLESVIVVRARPQRVKNIAV